MLCSAPLTGCWLVCVEEYVSTRRIAVFLSQKQSLYCNASGERNKSKTCTEEKEHVRLAFVINETRVNTVLSFVKGENNRKALSLIERERVREGEREIRREREREREEERERERERELRQH